MAGTLYLDASALLKLIIEEPESRVLAERLRDTRVASSHLSRVEVRRAVVRAGLGPGAFALTARMLAPVHLHHLDVDILDRASEIGPPALRTLDTIHLASALAIGRELDAVVTYDRRLAMAAEDAGLRVESPA
jgi:predicted nucleic acid-binding protein